MQRFAHPGEEFRRKLLAGPACAGDQHHEVFRQPAAFFFERSEIFRLLRQFGQFDGAGIVKECADQIDVPFDRMPRWNREAVSVEIAGERFPRRGESDNRAALGEKGEKGAPGQALKIEDEIVPLAAEIAPQPEKFRQQGAELPEFFAFKQDRFRNRPRAVAQDFREGGGDQKVQLRLRQPPVQFRQRREEMDDVTQTARFDDQNAFDSAGVDHNGFAGVTFRRRAGAPAVRAGRRR